MTVAGQTIIRDQRRGDVDAIRATLVIGLVFFHTANIFDLLPYAVKNEQTSILLMAFVGFFSQWGMPLLFFMAGMATWHSLGKRTPGQFIAERIKRLAIPFITGLCVVVPPQRYYGLLTNPDYHDSFWRFYPKFFRVAFEPSFPQFIGADPAAGVFEISHLWFLYYLFFFSLMALPLLLYLRRERGRRFAAWLAEACDRKGAILSLAIPIVSIELFFRLGQSGGWNRFSFLGFLLYGYLFASTNRFDRSARDNWAIALTAGAGCIAAFFWMSVITWQAGVDPSRGYALANVLWRLFKGCSSWFWVLAIWGIGQRLKKHRAIEGKSAHIAAPARNGLLSKVLEYANEAVLPFYIIHQTVIVIIGFHVVKWRAGVGVKYFTISLASVAMTFLLYDVFVRRTNVTRLLFGMKSKKRDSAH